MKLFYKIFLPAFFIFFNSIFLAAEEKTVTVSGIVTDESNNPIEGAIITVTNNDDTVYKLFSGPDGSYEFQVLADIPSSIHYFGTHKGYGVGGVYPNPVSSNATAVIYYRSPEKQNTPQLQIFDVSGRMVSSPWHLQTGTYFYRLVFEEKHITKARAFSVGDGGNISFDLRRQELPAYIESGAALKSSFLAEPITGNTINLVFEKDLFVTQERTLVLEAETAQLDASLPEALAPTADFTISGELKEGEVVYFDASSSTGNYGETLQYSWHLGDVLRTTPNAASRIFMQPGQVDITLAVTGKYGTTQTIQKLITIVESPAQGYAEVLGQVYNVWGQPLDSVYIQVHQKDSVYMTNRDGEAGLDSLPTGKLMPLRLIKPGYATQYVTLEIPAADSQAYFEATLMKREAAITLENIENGGAVKGSDGTMVELPANAMVFDDGTPVTGDIEVYLTPVDVSDSSAYFAFPGAFAGLTPDGFADLILSYGTVEFHFEQAGREVHMKDGEAAVVEVPVYLPKALDGTDLGVGDTIPQWSLDPATGIWVMEGYGTIVPSDSTTTGYAFRAHVGHFSWWNCDIAPDPFYPEIVPQVGSAPGGGNGGGGPAPGTPLPASVSGTPVGGGGLPSGGPRFAPIPLGGASLPVPPGQDIYLEAHANNGLYKGSKTINGKAGETTKVVIDVYPVFGAEGDNLIAPDTLFDAAIDSVGDIDRFAFQADSGFTYNITVSRSGGSNLIGTVKLRDPDNLPLTSTDFNNNAGYFSFSSKKDGKYFIVVDGTDNEPGGYSLSLRIVTTIMPDNEYISNLQGAGDMRQFAFEGKAGELINIAYLSEGVSGRIYLRLFDKNGATLYNQRQQGFARTGTVLLPHNGVYMAEIYGVDASSTGEFRLGISNILPPAELEPEIPWNDTTDSLSLISDLRYYRFTANRGDVLNFSLATQDSLTSYARLYQAGDNFFNKEKVIYDIRTTNYNSSYQSSEPYQLVSFPDTGTYYISVEPWGNQKTQFAGKATITLFNPEKRLLNADVEVYDSIKKSFHFHKYQLSFAEKQAVVVRSINWNFSSYLYTSIFDTSATRNAVRSDRISSNYGAATKELAPVLLQGDYIIEQNPTGGSHGTYGMKVITLDDPVDVTSSAPYTEVTGEIDEVGERDYYRIAGNSGQVLSLDLIVPDTSFLYGNIRIYTETDNWVSGTTLRDDIYNTASAELKPGATGGITVMLPHDSTYIIEVDGVNTLLQERGYGNYLLRVNTIDPAAEIHVDDDNADYPQAITGFVRSATRAITAGGNVIVHPGEYYESLEVRIVTDNVTLKGTSRDDVIVRSPDRITVSLYANNPIIEDIYLDPAQYRAIEGHFGGENAIIRNVKIEGGGAAIKITNKNGVLIEDNIVDVSSGGTAIDITGDNNRILNNTLNQNGNYNVNSGIVARGNHILIESNNIGSDSTRNISFNGIIVTSDSSMIKNNIISNYITAISVSPSDKNIDNYTFIENNTLGNLTGSNGGNSDGIRVSQIDYAFVRSNFLNGHPDIRRGINFFNSGGEVVNNRIKVKRFTSMYYDYVDAAASPELLIANNTFVNNSTYPNWRAVNISSSQATASVRFINNIVLGTVTPSGGFSAIGSDKPLLQLDYNLISGYAVNYFGSAVAGANDVFSDPQLDLTTLKLNSGSPAINAGTNTYAPAVDFEDNDRNDGNVDIGADEF